MKSILTSTKTHLTKLPLITCRMVTPNLLFVFRYLFRFLRKQQNIAENGQQFQCFIDFLLVFLRKGFLNSSQCCVKEITDYTSSVQSHFDSRCSNCRDLHSNALVVGILLTFRRVLIYLLYICPLLTSRTPETKISQQSVSCKWSCWCIYCDV